MRLGTFAHQIERTVYLAVFQYNGIKLSDADGFLLNIFFLFLGGNRDGLQLNCTELFFLGNGGRPGGKTVTNAAVNIAIAADVGILFFIFLSSKAVLMICGFHLNSNGIILFARPYTNFREYR